MDLHLLQPAPGQGYQTKQAMVYESLRGAILDARLEPGQRLVIDDVAAALAVSPIPVREALGRLQREGLVVQRPHAGAVVATVPPEAIRELFALMEHLELVAVAMAVERIDETGLAGLRRHAATMAEAASQGDHDAWATANREFHHAIVAIAGLPLVAEFTERVFTQWDRLRRLAFREAAFDHAAADREHVALIAAFGARDGERLAELVRRHNRGALAAYLRLAPPPPSSPNP